MLLGMVMQSARIVPSESRIQQSCLSLATSIPTQTILIPPAYLFDEYDLLIIDDLGVERSTEYAMEQMFFVIDSRYRSRRPMIITTNLKLSELKNPPDLAHARIYDRILERCAPILFDGKNFREENAGATRQTAKDIVNSKHD